MIGAKNIDAHDGMFIIVNTTPGRQLSLLNLDYFALSLAPYWILQREDDVVLLGHAAHVQDGITHAAQRRVDAHTGGVGNLLEAHVLVVSHDEHLTL